MGALQFEQHRTCDCIHCDAAFSAILVELAAVLHAEQGDLMLTSARHGRKTPHVRGEFDQIHSLYKIVKKCHPIVLFCKLLLTLCSSLLCS